MIIRMKKDATPAVQSGSPEYRRYMALLRVTVCGLAKKEQKLEKEDLRGYLAELRRKSPRLIEALALNREEEDRLLDDVQKELLAYYGTH